jgi:F0F1-type ATP synthase gamma subunit
MNKEEILNIANEAYPKIVKHFGKGEKSIPEIKIYRNVFVDLTGDEDAEGEDTPSGRYDRDVNKISLYSDYIPNKEELLRALIHEYTHYKQPDGIDQWYYDKGYTYQNNPAELEALKAEEQWFKFI